MKRVNVILLRQAKLQPRAECLGDDPDQDADSNCPMNWHYGSGTLLSAKSHVKANPTHQVLVVHETRSLYGAQE